ncbi:MAG TPA: hypothetical protein VHC22_21930 [Pirellulales bacterium]|nr:hypothetical protein [Pirellulales bacterium]
MPQKIDGPGDAMTPQNCTNIVQTLANAYATCFHVFLRTDFGDEAFGGLTGPGSMVIILLVWGSDTTGFMLYYFWLWIAFLLLQRMRQGLNRRLGRVAYSRYNGFPKVAKQLFRCKTETQARTIEPVICLLVGIPLMYYDFEVAGKFITGGAAALWVVETSIRWADNRKVQQLRDAQIQAQRLSAMAKGHEF